MTPLNVQESSLAITHTLNDFNAISYFHSTTVLCTVLYYAWATCANTSLRRRQHFIESREEDL